MKNFGKAFAAALCLAGLAGATEASANQCLQSVSNQDLLNEISRRMNGAGSAGGLIQATAACDIYSWNEKKLVVRVVNLETVKESVTVLDNLSLEKCDAVSAQLNQKFREFSGPTMFAYCAPYSWYENKLVRKVLKADGTISELVSTIKPITECEAEATQINSN